MNRTKLKNYAPQARRDFIQAVSDRAALYGLTKNKIEPVTENGDVAIIGGIAFPRIIAEKRHRLAERIHILVAGGKKPNEAFEQVMEAVAYTWFNRLVAIRYMELHGFLDHGYRVLSNPNFAKTTPEIVEHAEQVDLPGLDKQTVVDLKLDGTKESELYRMLLIAQCNALHKAMPFLFERIDDETELLLPDNLLHSDSIIRKLVNEIDEDDWQEVEIIGWLYQFYISEKKDEVIGKVVKSEDIPAATQLFTPNWIVKYLVQNSLGRQWLATYPQSPLKGKMEFYIEPAEQTPDVQAELKKITPESQNPEELTLMDPACGSGHILVEAYDLLKEIYLERGYRLRDIPKLILTKNLFGLEIDDRAAQLAAFALMMKARADDRRIFDGDAQPNVLAIQESNGLNVNAIVQAFTEKKITDDGDLIAGDFAFMGAVRAPLFATENSATATVGDKLAADLKAVFAVFDNAKTYGSLIQIPERLAERLPSLAAAVSGPSATPDLPLSHVINTISRFISQAMLLARNYDAVVANPPYMGSKVQNSLLKLLGKEHYEDTKTDLFSMFIERGYGFAKAKTGHNAMVTMHSWMFLSSFEAMRDRILLNRTITSMAHLGPRAFREISGEVVTVTAFSTLRHSLPSYRPAFFRLIEGDDESKRAALSEGKHRYDIATQKDFKKIPGSPMAYWVSGALRAVFGSAKLLSDIATPRQGLATGENARFVRWWTEVSAAKIGFSMSTREEAKASGLRWFPYNKGGQYRKWYGNQGFVVNWENDGQEIRGFADADGNLYSRPQNTDFYFKPSLSWSKVASEGFALRFFPQGHVFDVAGCSIFMERLEEREMLLGCMNSPVMTGAINALSPTLNFEVGQVAAFPVMPEMISSAAKFTEPVRQLIALAKRDWDTFETSWDFERSPLLDLPATRISECLTAMREQRQILTMTTRKLEEENNRIFIEAYGLANELRPVVPLEKVTLLCNPAFRYGPGDGDTANVERERSDTAYELLSYALGCAMGRYSLDKHGLIYANSGNEGFDPSQYKSFPADKDGIIPVTEPDWFANDAAHRFEEFVSVAWPKEHLEENLKFVADSLSAKSGEQPRDAIRRYFADDFYKHHLQTYKRRPIYWLFTSGKLGAFQALVYLHRYNEGTLARMRTEYVIPLQGKMNSRIDQLDGDKAKATSTAHRKRLEKEQESLKKQQVELVKFDEKLRHYADLKIKLDLDDGVKLNYAKFGDLLAEVTKVCGKGDDDE